MKQGERDTDLFFGVLFQMELFQTSFWCKDAEWGQEELKSSMLKGTRLINSLLEKSKLTKAKSVLTDKEKNTLVSAIEYLTEAFSFGTIKIRKEQLPLLICLAEVAQNEEILPEVFKEWWEIVVDVE